MGDQKAGIIIYKRLRFLLFAKVNDIVYNQRSDFFDTVSYCICTPLLEL